MSNSVRQLGALAGTRPATSDQSGSRLAISGRLFFLFALELFLLGMVLWAYLIIRSLIPDRPGRSTDLEWGLVALAAAGWGTWFLVQSRNAAIRWNGPHSRNLLAIVVASGAVLIGTLLVQVAAVLISNPIYIDARPKVATLPIESKSDSVAGAAGDASNGKKWFSMSCVSCHGPTGEGVANAAPSLRASNFLKTADDQAIAALIRNGRSVNDPANMTGKVMPAKGGNPFLDESKIADLVAFLKDLDAQLDSASSADFDSAAISGFETVQSQLANQPVKVIKKWTLEDLADLPVSVNEESVRLGMLAFVKATCNKCHMAAIAGQELGPTLDQIVTRYPTDKVLQHVVDPSLEINEKFRSDTFLLLDGRVLTGVIAREADDEVKLITDLLNPEMMETIPLDEIDDRVKSNVSPMPPGLVDVLTKDEIAGLIAYIDAAGNQLVAAKAPQLNRWVVPAAEVKTAATTWAVTKPKLAHSNAQLSRQTRDSRYATRNSWLFGIATSVLAIHFLWVIGAGSAIILNEILHLGTATQVQLAQQVSLFWSIGLAWLVVWFVAFFLTG